MTVDNFFQRATEEVRAGVAKKPVAYVKLQFVVIRRNIELPCTHGASLITKHRSTAAAASMSRSLKDLHRTFKIKVQRVFFKGGEQRQLQEQYDIHK
jgi:hypothetical protein